jgi:hypothetical protein
MSVHFKKFSETEEDGSVPGSCKMATFRWNLGSWQEIRVTQLPLTSQMPVTVLRRAT